MVSRKFRTTTATATCLEVAKQKTCIKHFTLPREYKNDAKLLRVLQKLYNTEDFKVVHIMDAVNETKLYGMTEQDFLDQAIELDETTRKPILN